MSNEQKLLTACVDYRAKLDKLEAELAAAQGEVSELTDALDMMRDEFMRIIACPGCNAEIEDLADRAQLKLVQHVPVIVQRDKAEHQLSAARAELAALREDRDRLDWLEGNAGDIPKYNSRSFVWFANQNIRASIDAARKEAQP